jgi:hypothetical protein
MHHSLCRTETGIRVPAVDPHRSGCVRPYTSTPDMSGGFGEAGVKAIEQFLDAGDTPITTLQAVRYPIDFGLARSVDLESPQEVNAQKPLIFTGGRTMGSST